MFSKPIFHRKGVPRRIFLDPRKERVLMEADAAVATLAKHFRELGRVVDEETDAEIQDRMKLVALALNSRLEHFAETVENYREKFGRA
jgi:hypothetical protein